MSWFSRIERVLGPLTELAKVLLPRRKRDLPPAVQVDELPAPPKPRDDEDTQPSRPAKR